MLFLFQWGLLGPVLSSTKEKYFRSYVMDLIKQLQQTQPLTGPSPYAIEHATSGRARCRSCAELIEKGDLRIVTFSNIMQQTGASYTHLYCFLGTLQIQPQHIGGFNKLNDKEKDLAIKGFANSLTKEEYMSNRFFVVAPSPKKRKSVLQKGEEERASKQPREETIPQQAPNIQPETLQQTLPSPITSEQQEAPKSSEEQQTYSFTTDATKPANTSLPQVGKEEKRGDIPETLLPEIPQVIPESKDTPSIQTHSLRI